MTHNERVLHTVLSTCMRPVPEATGDKIGVLKAKLAYMTNRLEEISKIVEIAVSFNAAKNEKGE